MYMNVLKVDRDSLQKRDKKQFMDYSSMEYMHKWVTSQYHKSRAQAQILCNYQYQKNEIYIYIQANEELPDKNLEKAGMRLLKRFELPPAKEETVCFKIVCAPVIRNGHSNRERFIKDTYDREQWLISKLSGCMEDIQVQETGTTVITGKALGENKDRNLYIRAAEFKGVGHITDPEKFEQLVKNGVGRYKNYGCGLLLYKPA